MNKNQQASASSSHPHERTPLIHPQTPKLSFEINHQHQPDHPTTIHKLVHDIRLRLLELIGEQGLHPD